MARMLVAPVDRWLVKALSLRMMAGLPLHASQQRMLGQFIDIYLPLPHPQEVAFRQEVAGFLPHEQEVVMENIGSWERKGRAEGRKEGRKEGQQQLITRLLARRFGALPAELANALNPLTSAQLVALGEALLDFTSLVDLQDWLAALRAQEINLPDVP
jgi:hypothetical protein